MHKNNFKFFLFFVIGMMSAIMGMYLFNNYKIEKKEKTEVSQKNPSSKNNDHDHDEEKKSSEKSGNIDELTAEKIVIDFVKANKKLPDYYITKAEARNQGWVPSQGNLCDVLPGRAIGGDKFSNREKSLPKGEQYFEADVNYSCGNRNAHRIVFTKNGTVWLTHDHYKSFQKQ